MLAPTDRIWMYTIKEEKIKYLNRLYNINIQSSAAAIFRNKGLSSIDQSKILKELVAQNTWVGAGGSAKRAPAYTTSGPRTGAILVQAALLGDV